MHGSRPKCWLRALFLLINFPPMSEKSPESLRSYGFNLLETDLKFLMEAFVATLKKIGEGDLAKRLPWVGGQEGKISTTDRKLGQAYSIAFQLLNIVEE